MSESRSPWVYPDAAYYELLVSCESQKIDDGLLAKIYADVYKPDVPLEVLFVLFNREKSLKHLWPKSNLNMRDQFNPTTGLCYAMRFNQPNLVSVYLNPRPGQNKIYVLKNANEVASLHIDAFYGEKENLDKLKVDILDPNKGPALKNNLLQADQFERLPLHVAIMGGNADMVKFMLAFTKAEAYDLTVLPTYALESRNAQLAPLFMNKLTSNAEKHGDKYFEKYGSFDKYAKFLLKAATMRNKNPGSEIVTLLNSISDTKQKEKWVTVFREEALKAGFSDIFIALTNSFIPAEHLISSLIGNLFTIAESNPLEKTDTSKLVTQCYMSYIQKNPHYLYEILYKLVSEKNNHDVSTTEDNVNLAIRLLSYMPNNVIEAAKSAGNDESVQDFLSTPEELSIREDHAITYKLFELAKAGKDFMPLRENYKKYFSNPNSIGTPFNLLCAAHLEFFAGDYKQARKYFEESLEYSDLSREGVISLAAIIMTRKILALLENTNCEIAPHFIRFYKENFFKLVNAEHFNFKLPSEALLFINSIKRKDEELKVLLDAIDEIEEILPPFKNSDETESWHLLYEVGQNTKNIDDILTQLYNQYINTNNSKNISPLSARNCIAISMMKKNLFNFMYEINLRLKNSSIYKSWMNDPDKSYETRLQTYLTQIDKKLIEITDLIENPGSNSQQAKNAQGINLFTKTHKTPNKNAPLQKNTKTQETPKELKLTLGAKEEKEKAADRALAKLIAADEKEKQQAEKRAIKARQKQEKNEANRLAIAAQKAAAEAKEEAERKIREEATAAEKAKQEALEKAAAEAKMREEMARKAREEEIARAEAELKAQEEVKAATKAKQEALEKAAAEAKAQKEASIQAEANRQADEQTIQEATPPIFTAKTNRSAAKSSDMSILSPAVTSARAQQQKKKKKNPPIKTQPQHPPYVLHRVPIPMLVPPQQVQALHQYVNAQQQQMQLLQQQRLAEMQQWQHQVQMQQMQHNQEILNLRYLQQLQLMQYAQEMQKAEQINREQQIQLEKQRAFIQQVQLEQQEEFAYQLQLARKNTQAARYIEKQSEPRQINTQQSAHTHAVSFGIPSAIAKLYDAFEGRIFLVGGANRDYYWNVKPHDHDHVLFATLAEFKLRFPNVTYVTPPTESFISCIIDGYKADFILRPCKSREENLETLFADAQGRDLTMNTAYREFTATGSHLVSPISAKAKQDIKNFHFDLANYAFGEHNFMMYPVRRYRALFLEHKAIGLGAKPTYSQIYIDNINKIKIDSEAFIAACRRNCKAVRSVINKEISYDKAGAYRILIDEKEDNTLLNAGIFSPDDLKSLRDAFIYDFLRCILSLKDMDSNLSKITCLMWHYLDITSRKAVACTSIGTSKLSLFAKRYESQRANKNEPAENTLFEKEGGAVRRRGDL